MESELRDSDAVRTWPEKGGSVAAEKEGDHCLLDTLKRSQPSGDALEISFLVRQIASTKGVLWRTGNRNIPTTHPPSGQGLPAGASISQPQSFTV